MIIFFTNDNSTVIKVKRLSSIIFHGQSGKTYRELEGNLKQYDLVYLGQEELWIQPDDYFLMIKSIYRGKRMSKFKHVLQSRVDKKP